MEINVRFRGVMFASIELRKKKSTVEQTTPLLLTPSFNQLDTRETVFKFSHRKSCNILDNLSEKKLISHKHMPPVRCKTSVWYETFLLPSPVTVSVEISSIEKNSNSSSSIRSVLGWRKVSISRYRRQRWQCFKSAVPNRCSTDH